MNAAILAIGSEILQGFLVDTNSSWLAQELTALGIEVTGIHGVGDNLTDITRTMEFAMTRADILVCTGGIGPTADDLSREAVARICGEQPEVDLLVLEEVRSFFTRRGSDMPERNAKQAWTIPSADILRNPMGTAPGWFARTRGKSIVLMPGIPREMMPMWQNEVVPRLMARRGGDAIVSRTLKTIGIGESSVEETLAHIIERPTPSVSTFAKNDGVHVRILAISSDEQEAAKLVERTEREIRQLLGFHIYGDLDTSLPAAVLSPLLERNETLVCFEVGTAGQVASLLMGDPEVASAVADARVRPGKRAGMVLPDLDELRQATAMLRSSAAADAAVGVIVRPGQVDDLGRLDATIDVLVDYRGEAHHRAFTFAAREIELGRRASLFAAEECRAAFLGSTAGRQT